MGGGNFSRGCGGKYVFKHMGGEVVWGGKIFSHLMGGEIFIFLTIIYIFYQLITDIIHNARCTDIQFPFLS